MEKYSAPNDGAVINNLNGSYLYWAKNQLIELHKHLHSLKQSDLRDAENIRTEILNHIQNFTGLSRSFGYYLMTDIADSLNKYIRSVEDFSNVYPDIIASHFNAMDFIIHYNIEGYGGERGNKIIAQLQEKLQKSTPRVLYNP